MTNRYEIIIFWSDEDQAFIADVPELPGCMAHGSSHAEALSNSQEAIALSDVRRQDAAVEVTDSDLEFLRLFLINS